MIPMYYKENLVRDEKAFFAQSLIYSNENQIVFGVLHGVKSVIKSIEKDFIKKDRKLLAAGFTSSYSKEKFYFGTDLEVIARGASLNGEYIVVANPNKVRLITFIKSSDMEQEENIISEEIEEIIKNQVRNEIPFPILDIVPGMEQRVVKFIYNFAQGISSDYKSHFDKSSGIVDYIDFSFIEKPEFINELKIFIMKNHGEIEFINEFGRAPQIASVRLMVDVKKFSLKSFQELLKRFGGKDNFEKLSFDIQKNIIYGYEFFGVDIYNLFKAFGESKFLSLSLKDLAVKQKTKGNLKANKLLVYKFLEATTSDFVFANAIIESLYDDDFLSEFRKIKVNDLEDANKVESIKLNLIQKLSSLDYDIKPGGEAMALACSRLMMSNDSFLQYQEEYIKNIVNTKRAKQYPTVSGTVGNQYSWEVIDMSDPNAWLVGLETNCCQHLGSVGGDCVLYAAKHPELSGIMRVMKKGKTVAQSFFWFNQEIGDFVFDNIEVLGGELRPAIREAYFQYIAELEKRPMFGVKRVCFGLGYSDVNSWKFENVSNPTKLSSLPDGVGVYSDASSQKLLKQIKD